MISIIICSRHKTINQSLYNNIKKTCGIPYELIVIDNSENRYSSLASAYNEGVRKSRNAILCFMHDDIVYHTKGWGEVILSHFQENKVGMIGVGGTRYLSNIPSIWWAGGHKYISSVNGTICHNSIDTNRENIKESVYNVVNPEDRVSTRVTILDGLWFCVRREIFDFVQFDDHYYDGFHFYDLDLSMQINKLGFELRSIFNIKLEHISASKLDKKWLENCFKFYKKWQSDLPISSFKLPFRQKISIDYESLRFLYDIHNANKIPFHVFSNVSISTYRKIIFLYTLYFLFKFREIFNC
jgi:GT2 family glycosyltransferase